MSKYVFINSDFVRDLNDVIRSYGIETLKDKRVSLVFSGGIDSTMLLEYLINTECKLELVNINIKNNYDQMGKESLASKEIIELLRKHYDGKDNLYWSYPITTNHEFLFDGGGINSIKSQYPILIPFMASSNGEYVMNGMILDDIETFVVDGKLTTTINEFHNIFDAFSRIQNRPTKLLLPLMGIHKHELLGNYCNDIPKLLSSTYWCERFGDLPTFALSPSSDECECNKCRKLRRAMSCIDKNISNLAIIDFIKNKKESNDES